MPLSSLHALIIRSVDNCLVVGNNGINSICSGREWEKFVHHRHIASLHFGIRRSPYTSRTARIVFLVRLALRPILTEPSRSWYLLLFITMLIGEYEHTLDDKKRVSLPKSFAKALGKKMVMTRGLDSCLFLFSTENWEKVAGKLQELSFAAADTRGFNRFLLSGAVEVEPDASGRILIGDVHKHFAGLKKTVVFAGVSDRVEIWDATSWKQYKARIEKQADAMAEKLGEIGAL